RRVDRQTRRVQHAVVEERVPDVSAVETANVVGALRIRSLAADRGFLLVHLLPFRDPPDAVAEVGDERQVTGVPAIGQGRLRTSPQDHVIAGLRQRQDDPTGGFRQRPLVQLRYWGQPISRRGRGQGHAHLLHYRGGPLIP